MNKGVICLFDVDGTLTKPRNVIEPGFLQQLLALQSRVPIAVVSGSDFAKVAWQLGGEPVMEKIGYVFSENGLVVHRFGKLIQSTSIVDYLGEELIQKFINYALGYLSKLELPRKRGTFVEFRKGLINICPVGRSCTQAERDEFAEYDEIHRVRERFVEDMRKNFGHTELQFAIGGQISIDVFPKGWDKRYCLQFLTDFPTIHFFGDKTAQGGNDYEVFSDPRTIGHTVQSPKDTSHQLNTLFPFP
ncbi:unnamed protein product [Echinostoma caproni]|uniref:Phosphomannomutase n=1 Tax=Echinostoma caproni TaxID=27848 RepID=A0A183AQX6_9TREM|nr:unnamed protein product [Echinostoma caproni]